MMRPFDKKYQFFVTARASHVFDSKLESRSFSWRNFRKLEWYLQEWLIHQLRRPDVSIILLSLQSVSVCLSFACLFLYFFTGSQETAPNNHVFSGCLWLLLIYQLGNVQIWRLSSGKGFGHTVKRGGRDFCQTPYDVRDMANVSVQWRITSKNIRN